MRACARPGCPNSDRRPPPRRDPRRRCPCPWRQQPDPSASQAKPASAASGPNRGFAVRRRVMTCSPSRPRPPLLCRFLDAGGTKPLGTLGEPASKKRRGTKSRGVWGRVGSQRYGDLIFAPIMTVGAKLAPGGLDRVRKGSWKRALGISVAAWGVSTGGRIVDWRGFAERDRRRRRASAAERESGGARRRSGS